jgi:O-Antigen ligase
MRQEADMAVVRRARVPTLSLEQLTGWAYPLVVPFLFVDVAFMPGVTSGTSTIDLADLMLLAVVGAALVELRRSGPGPLRSSLWIWGTGLALVAYLGAASLYPIASDSHYAWKTHLVTAVKFAEYAVLAPAGALLLRDARAVRRLCDVVAALSVVAGAVAVLQFAGLHFLRAWSAGNRQPSFTGLTDLGVLGAAAIAVGFAAVVWPELAGRRAALAALIGGTVDVVVSGEAAAGLGVGAVAIAVLLLGVRRSGPGRGRRTAVVVGVTAICAIGLLGIRGGDITQFGRFVGLLPKQEATTQNVQTYSQRTLMLYIGLRVWEAHPVLGAGWQSIRETQVYTPFLAAAHRRFPDLAAESFPSPQNQWGVDDAYVQSLAELGLAGTAVFLLFLATGVRLGVRGVLHAPPEQSRRALLGLLWLLVSICIWTGQGLVAGAGFTALPFFALGLIAAQRAGSAAARVPR